MAVGNLKNGFVVAMAAEFSFSDYHRPFPVLRTITQWIIVSRCGPRSEFVTVANAAGRVMPRADAPIGLFPIKTLVGTLASETPDESTFLLVRQQPAQLSIAGAFFPPMVMSEYPRCKGFWGCGAKGATHIAWGAMTAIASAKTYLIQRQMREGRWLGTSRGPDATGSANSSQMPLAGKSHSTANADCVAGYASSANSRSNRAAIASHS